MDEANTAPTGTLVEAFQGGWIEYQRLLLAALAPLTPDQLALHAGADLRTIDEIARHMIGARARWMHAILGDEYTELMVLRHWDASGAPIRPAAELVAGLQDTWGYIQDALEHWTPAEFASTYTRTRGDQTRTFSRQWVIWHLIEHDLHHGGEISLTLGMHGLAAPDI